jgi:hypothetical protein
LFKRLKSKEINPLKVMLTLEMAIQKIQQLPPEQQNKVFEFIESLESQPHQADSAQLQKEPKKKSFAEAAHEFIGCLDSDIEDLSHNPQYLEGFGR